MKILLFPLFLFFILILFPNTIHAQMTKTPSTTYVKAQVIKIIKDEAKDVGGRKNSFQLVEVRILEGLQKQKLVQVSYGGNTILSEEKKVNSGDTVILSIINTNNKTQYVIADMYRLDSVLFLFLAFFIVVIIMAGKKGFGSVLGLIISFAVIVYFIVPQIISGSDPLMISIIGSLFIMITTIYLAHGFSHQTTIAIIATFLSLVCTGIFAVFFVRLLHLSGLGSEDIATLQLTFRSNINYQGLLLGGIIIGTLGVLDDTTTTQSTTISELARANPSLSMKELMKRGMRVGREHIASLVNTLVLAYAGASIGIFIFISLTIQNNTHPLWVILNSELLTEEVVRTLAGSMGLILAVPITTLLASFFAKYSVHVK